MKLYSFVGSGRALSLLVMVGTAVFALLGVGQILAFAGAGSQSTLTPADSHGDSTCFTTYGTFTTTQFESSNATAVQNAVAAAADGDVVKIAGFCAGVQTLHGFTQTVHISKNITLEGGYSEMDWTASPDPDTFTTTLDATEDGRGVTIIGSHAVTLSNLTIQNGFVDGTGVGGGVYNENSQVTIWNGRLLTNGASDGGAIYNETGWLHLVDSIVRHNEAHAVTMSEYRGGGGVYNDEGHVIIENSEIISNTSEWNGGGIVNGRYMTVSNSLIADNRGTLPPTSLLQQAATPQNFNNTGGGIANLYGNIWIQNSTIRDNIISGWGGGGLGHTGGTSYAFISDSTIEGNNANGGQGGGILYSQNLTLTNSTVSGNLAEVGGGLYNHQDNSATAVLQYSTIANNTANVNGNSLGFGNANGVVELTSSILSSAGNNCAFTGGGIVVDRGYNLESGSNCGLTMTTSLTETNPLLLPLADNGGDTETHALLASSPAIDLIPEGENGCGTVFVTDQRGEPRPLNNRCEAGSFEGLGRDFLIYLPVVLNSSLDKTRPMK